MRAVAEERLEAASQAFRVHVDRCLGCRACETVCPSGVRYGSLLEVARTQAVGTGERPVLARLVLRLFASRGATRISMLLSQLLRATGLPALAARVLPALGPLAEVRIAMGMLAATAPWRPTGLSAARAGGRRPRRPRAEGHGGGASVGAAAGPVGLLEGCVQEGLFAHVNRATERVLSVNGLETIRVPGQGCCGALHAHGGDLEGARALARRNVGAFEAAGVEVVVANAAGCGAAMKEYGELLAHDPSWAERARAFAARVRDVSEVLAERGPLPGGPLRLVATYDAPCHLLHAQRVDVAPKAVLAAIPGIELRPLQGEEECCGGAGIYGLTHARLGGWIGDDKAGAVEATGAEVVATGNPGCMMQIGARLRMRGSEVRTAHPVELLDESYRVAGLYPAEGRPLPGLGGAR